MTHRHVDDSARLRLLVEAVLSIGSDLSLPDALRRIVEASVKLLDAQYGATPDLASLPMYCVVTAVKDPYDTKDMRTTANNDVNFAMDVPPFDATVVARRRAKGALR